MPMKLILRSDVENLGRLGDLVTVKPGYGRNCLVPKKLAMPATKANLKVFEQERLKLEKQMNEVRAQAQSEAERIANAEVVIEVRVGDGGKLYGSVTSNMIADNLAEQGIELDRRKIELEQPIRAIGRYKINVKLHPDVHETLNVVVKPIGAPMPEDEPGKGEASGAEAAEASAPEAEQDNAAAEQEQDPETQVQG